MSEPMMNMPIVSTAIPPTSSRTMIGTADLGGSRSGATERLEKDSFFVHRGTRGLRITNDDPTTTWRDCEVEIAGGYHATLGTLNPQTSGEVYYDEFQSGGQKLSQDGYGRALESLVIRCDDSQGNRHGIRWGLR